MSAVYGANRTKYLDPTTTNTLSRGLFGGKLRVAVDSYEASTLTNGSTIAVGQTLAIGDKVVAVLLSCDALGTSTTLSIGDAGSATRYQAAVSTQSAVAGSIAIPADGMGYTVTGTDDTIILLTLGGGNATGTVKVTVLYVKE